MEYVLRNENGKYLSRNKDTGKMILIESLDKAITYQSALKASQVSKKLPMLLGEKWSTIPKNCLKKQANKTEEISIEDLRNVVKNINSQSEKLSQIKERLINDSNNTSNLINKYDLAIGDILHFVEKYDDLDMYTSWKLIKLLSTLRKKRRKLKQQRALATALQKNEKVSSKLESEIENIGNDGYGARVLNGLFKNHKDIKQLKNTIDDYIRDFS